MRAGRTEVHIDRISLKAMPAGGERRLREAIERELAQNVDLGAGAAKLPEAGDSSERIAARIRHAVNGGLAS